MLRLKSRGTSFLGSMAAPNLKRKALKSWAAVQDTFFSTKDTFERHKVVFTIGTSIASVATAWFVVACAQVRENLYADGKNHLILGVFEVCFVVFFLGGYSLRHYHESKVDQRLESIEKAMKNSHHLEHADFKKLVDPGPSRTAAWVATAGTALVVGYGLGWRGGTWYANRKFRREQLKLLEQAKPKRWQMLGKIKPRDWQLRFLRPSGRSRWPDSGSKTSEMTPKNAPTSCKSMEASQAC